MKRFFGFTLSEVLITLTVIGVVAAITLPPLIQNYQKQVFVNQLKKEYSTINQAFQKIMADEGVDSIDNLSDDANGIKISGNQRVDLGKYLKIVDNKEEYSSPTGYKLLYGGTFSTYNLNTLYLSDGAILFINPYDTPFINIDVNGKKGPNVVGRDLFCFNLHKNGRLVPYGDDNGYRQTRSSDERVNEGCRLGGEFCAARIMRDGWKMNY